MFKLRSLLLSALLFCSCSSQEEKVFHNYDEIKNSLISWDDVFIQKEDDYLVYFYSELCGHCSSIKQDIIKFFLDSEHTMYFVCTDYKKVIGPSKDLVGINSIDEFYIFGTPFLLEVKDHMVSNYYAGKNEILDTISILIKN